MVLRWVFRARHVRQQGIGGEVRHGVTSGVLCETSFNKHVTSHLHREYTRSTLQDSRLFGPSPWKILALIV